MIRREFDRNEHVYRNDAFRELVMDAIRFFNGTPVHPLPPREDFLGVGVYALYYTGSSAIYRRYAELNRLSYSYPIYVGKAVPSGWRQGRVSDTAENQSNELQRRLHDHSHSIDAATNLNLEDFSCRFVIFEGTSSNMIGVIEAELIRLNRPLWNSAVDGFGNHDPGSGRYRQAKSDWDVIHPGRIWAERCMGEHNSEQQILSRIEGYLEGVGRTT